MASPRPQLPLRPSDLSTYARIRNAALEGFAAKGIGATSIRDVAAMAGVSPGLVQHHFATKAGLRGAVDEYVIAVAVSGFEDLVRDGEQMQAWAAMGDTTTTWVRDNAIALRYVARALAEGDVEASKIFDAFVEIVRTRWLDPLARNGTLVAGLDRQWAVMHVILFNLASVLLEPAISHQLGAPFFSSEELQRWNAATTELYRRGLTKSATSKRPRKAS